MIRRFLAGIAILGLAGCAAQVPRPAPVVAGNQPIEVQILAINDFHGNLEPAAEPVRILTDQGGSIDERVGGAAQLAGALEKARTGQPNTITVAAGDLIGASPLSSVSSRSETSTMGVRGTGDSLTGPGSESMNAPPLAAS